MGILKKIKRAVYTHPLYVGVTGDTTELEKVKEEESLRTKEEERNLSSETTSSGDEQTCEACGMAIHGDQRSKKFLGKKYHMKPCYRNLIKQGKKLAKGY